MGYYSTFDYEITELTKLDLQKAKELEKFFEDENNDDIYGFQEVELELNSSGELIAISLADYYAKFYDSELFAKKLSECITEGNVFLYFIGEDGERWGYKVMPGKVEGITSLWLTEEDSNLFREFKENYDEFKRFLKLKNGVYYNFADNEMYGIVKFPKETTKEEIEEMLNRYREEDKYYDFDGFLDYLEEKGYIFEAVPLENKEIYF